MKKWKAELVIVLVLLSIGLGFWWYKATDEKRTANVEYKKLIKFSQRQAVEIAIIEQVSNGTEEE